MRYFCVHTELYWNSTLYLQKVWRSFNMFLKHLQSLLIPFFTTVISWSKYFMRCFKISTFWSSNHFQCFETQKAATFLISVFRKYLQDLPNFHFPHFITWKAITFRVFKPRKCSLSRFCKPRWIIFSFWKWTWPYFWKKIVYIIKSLKSTILGHSHEKIWYSIFVHFST